MAVAPEALELAEGAEGGAAEATKGVPGRTVPQASPAIQRAPKGGGTGSGPASAVSTPSAAGRTVTKLIWAIAVGLIVLEIAAQATGQHWSFNLPSVGRGPAPKTPYAPLYPGQQPLQATMPAVFGGLAVQPQSASLSGRAGGNLAVV